MRSFQELKVYQSAVKMRNEIRKLTRTFPQEEKYRLTDQMIRASRSVTNQIAEGYGRYHYQENIQMCRIARGSLEELHDHLNICLEEGLINDQGYQNQVEIKTHTRILLNGYIRYLHKSKQNTNT